MSEESFKLIEILQISALRIAKMQNSSAVSVVCKSKFQFTLKRNLLMDDKKALSLPGPFTYNISIHNID